MLDQVMGSLDRLEQHLTDAAAAHDAFAAAAVHHLDAECTSVGRLSSIPSMAIRRSDS